MLTQKIYKPTDKMSDLICENYNMLQVLTRFGLSLGFGDRTIEEVCREQQVDCPTFLVVVNFLTVGECPLPDRMKALSVPALMDYLKRAHSYYLDFELPTIRRKLIEAIDFTHQEEVSYLIIQFFDAYVAEVRKHMEYENDKVFTYVQALLEGVLSTEYNIDMFARHHEQINLKLTELKNIIIKYYPSGGDSQLVNATLFDIFSCEADLMSHTRVEDRLLVPVIQQLEMAVKTRQAGAAEADASAGGKTDDTLSQREKEIIGCVVRGLTNKEIADKLFISIHTVITHRRNISRKLQIHSVAGLTIYAIVNKLVELNEINTNI